MFRTRSRLDDRIIWIDILFLECPLGSEKEKEKKHLESTWCVKLCSVLGRIMEEEANCLQNVEASIEVLGIVPSTQKIVKFI